jgi:2-amino-4-hydroxy-6-hydroxymethyldihydropteridine diphosphokinase
MPEVFLGLGSNFDPQTHLPAALLELARRFGPLRVSSLYESAAVGSEGPPYHNLVVGFETSKPLAEVVALVADSESRCGRVRDGKPHAEIPIDIDLLAYGDAVIRSGRLSLPRRDILERAYVLEPLAEIAPDGRHPETGRRYADLWDAFDKAGLLQRRIGPWPLRHLEVPSDSLNFGNEAQSGPTPSVASRAPIKALNSLSDAHVAMIIPHRELSPEALKGVIEEFVTRESTDYGSEDISLAAKIAQVRRQLDAGAAFIVFDEEAGTCSILSREQAREAP